MFNMLPGIGRAKCYWSNIAVDLAFTSVGVDLCAHLFIEHHHVMFFFCVLNFRGWPGLQNYFNSKILPICGTSLHH